MSETSHLQISHIQLATHGRSIQSAISCREQSQQSGLIRSPRGECEYVGECEYIVRNSEGERHYDGDGAIIYTHACALGCEGIVSKRLGSPYRAGCSAHWRMAQAENRVGRWRALSGLDQRGQAAPAF